MQSVHTLILQSKEVKITVTEWDILLVFAFADVLLQLLWVIHQHAWNFKPMGFWLLIADNIHTNHIKQCGLPTC